MEFEIGRQLKQRMETIKTAIELSESTFKEEAECDLEYIEGFIDGIYSSCTEMEE